MPEGRPRKGTPFVACNEGIRMACSSNCPTPGAHQSWGECIRSKGLQIADVGAHLANSRQHNALNEYVRAREAGLQPKSVFPKDVKDAWKATDATGTPYRADKE